jgi:cAMP-binding proteins - catabolite gene activator and regulatory subunit of cAMP-dependent protein kinases
MIKKAPENGAFLLNFYLCSMSLQPLLTYISRYIQLTEEETNMFLSKVRIGQYKKGEYLVQNGQICRYESFVLKGCLRTYYIDNEGQEHIVMFAIENWWTADLGSFLTQTPSSYNVQCIEPCELAQLTYNDLEALYTAIPKLERFFRIIVQKAYVAAQKRIVNNFSLPAKERYIQFRERYPDIEQRVPQYMIASYLGITKEFLSKIRREL